MICSIRETFLYPCTLVAVMAQDDTTIDLKSLESTHGLTTTGPAAGTSFGYSTEVPGRFCIGSQNQTHGGKDWRHGSKD